MALDLRNVGQPTHRETEEPSPKRTGDRLADTSFSNTGRTDETNNLSLHGAAQLSDSKEFEDPRFNIGETIVISIEDTLRMRKGEVLWSVRAPRNLGRDISIRKCGIEQKIDVPV